MTNLGWNYPPGVTGNEPQITGEWPCDYCDSRGYDEDEDGKHSCELCGGTGIIPEDSWNLDDVKDSITKFFKKEGFGGIEIEYNEDFISIYTDLKVFGETVIRADL